MNANERFEIVADLFYRDTGFIRPGKSLPMEMCSTTPAHDDEYKKRGVELRDLRQALTQQAQEIERLKVEVVKRDCVLTLLHFIVEHDGDFDNPETVEAEAIGNGLENVLMLKQQFAASQARVRELDKRLEIVGKDFTANMLYQGQLERRNADLQAILAERERELHQKTQWLVDISQAVAWKDSSTLAQAIVVVVKALESNLDTARQDAARLREAAQNLTCAVCKMDMQRALKGA